MAGRPIRERVAIEPTKSAGSKQSFGGNATQGGIINGGGEGCGRGVSPPSRKRSPSAEQVNLEFSMRVSLTRRGLLEPR